jgi:MscS family membrane protein
MNTHSKGRIRFPGVGSRLCETVVAIGFLIGFVGAPGIFSAQAAEPSWTGQWDTRWRDGGARMFLQEREDKVAGEYPAYGGRIEGDVRGRELTGHWIEGPRSGGLDFVLAPDGQSFMGRFDNGEWWTGGRVVPSSSTVIVDQSGVRESLRTFVESGNAARHGDLDEMAKAADVLDFGEAGPSMAPGEKLAAASKLFELVSLTTFHLWSIPGKRAPGDHLDLVLAQDGSSATLPLSFVKKGRRMVNPKSESRYPCRCTDGFVGSLQRPHAAPGRL